MFHPLASGDQPGIDRHFDAGCCRIPGSVPLLLFVQPGTLVATSREGDGMSWSDRVVDIIAHAQGLWTTGGSNGIVRSRYGARLRIPRFRIIDFAGILASKSGRKAVDYPGGVFVMCVSNHHAQ